MEFAREWRIGLNGSYTQRAPSPEELFPNGPHAGTQAFEIGNPDFDKEVSRGLELTLHGRSHGIAFSGAVYHNWFSNFIFDQPTGAVADGLPVFAYAQAKARYFGMEMDVSARLGEWQGFVLKGDVVADYTRATIRQAAGSQPAPRIPAARALAGLEASSDKLDLRAEVEHTAGQSRTAPIETATPGYWLTNASLTWRPWGNAKKLSFLLSANNLFDVVARRHASFLKDYAPLAGRDIRVTVRVGM